MSISYVWGEGNLAPPCCKDLLFMSVPWLRVQYVGGDWYLWKAHHMPGLGQTLWKPDII